MDSQQLQHLEKFAEKIAAAAGRITLEYFGKEFRVEVKEDRSPVTEADKRAERLLREAIEKEFPDHGILGEEFGETNPGAEWRWIFDPIDGTRPFVAGVPQYAVLVALEHRGDSVVGVIHNPPLGRMMTASVGNGCKLNGHVVSVSNVSEISEANILSSCYANMTRRHPRQMAALLEHSRFAPGWGDGFGYMLVAEGKCDAMIDSGFNVWDTAAVKICIEEAKGRFTDWNGKADIRVDSGLAANPVLHRRLLEFLGEAE